MKHVEYKLNPACSVTWPNIRTTEYNPIGPPQWMIDFLFTELGFRGTLEFIEWPYLQMRASYNPDTNRIRLVGSRDFCEDAIYSLIHEFCHSICGLKVVKYKRGRTCGGYREFSWVYKNVFHHKEFFLTAAVLYDRYGVLKHAAKYEYASGKKILNKFIYGERE